MENNFFVISLFEMKNKVTEQYPNSPKFVDLLIEETLKDFSSKNERIEKFLKEVAYKNELKNMSRTFLIMNNLGVLGYFTLGLGTFEFHPTISKSQVKKLHGESSTADSMPCYLIMKLGKNYGIENNPVNIKVIFEELFKKIFIMQELIGGRIVVIECLEEKLKNHYSKNGFTVMPSDILKDGKEKYILVKSI